MIWLLRYWKPLAMLALLVAVWGHGHHVGAAGVQAEFNAHLLADAKQDAQDAKDLLAIAQKVRAQEQALAQANAAAAEAYEKGKQDAETASRAVVSGLRAGSLRLRQQWQGCQAERVSDAATRAAELDAEARDREESAGRIVRAAREADELIKALQDILRAERGRP